MEAAHCLRTIWPEGPLDPVPDGGCHCSAGGNLYGMGYNTLGQLGAGNQTSFSVPTLLGVGILGEGMVIAVEAGAFDTVVVMGMHPTPNVVNVYGLIFLDS